MSLLETYEQMRKEAQAEASTETEKIAQEVANEEMEVLQKYAAWAEEALIEHSGEGNYTEEDVEKLATLKLEEDAEEALRREKVAEYYEAGQIMYAGFKAAAEADNE